MSGREYIIRGLDDFYKRSNTAEEMIHGIRPIDREEIEGMGYTVTDGVLSSMFDTSTVYEARENGEGGALIAAWGIIPDGKRGALIWCLGTERMRKHKKGFVRDSGRIIEKWLEKYPLLYNTVSIDNEESIRWLKHFHATFSKPYSVKYKDKMYMDFYITREEFRCVQ